jgi:phage shock protein A
MDKQELTTLLKRLQSELASGQTVDAQLRQSLQTLDQDIQRVLAQGSPLSSNPDEASLNERAQEIESRFAAEHPYLSNTLRDLMDVLGKMGI